MFNMQNLVGNGIPAFHCMFSFLLIFKAISLCIPRASVAFFPAFIAYYKTCKTYWYIMPLSLQFPVFVTYKALYYIMPLDLGFCLVVQCVVVVSYFSSLILSDIVEPINLMSLRMNFFFLGNSSCYIFIYLAINSSYTI